MKKKIVIGLSVFSLIFLLGGIYIIASIERATSELDNLIKLHQVEILREHLLIQIKKVQYDLSLKGTRYARSIDTIVKDVRNMGMAANICVKCHHSKEATDMLNDLRVDIEKYKDALSRVLTIRANVERLLIEEDVTFKAGEGLIKKVNNVIALTTHKLSEKTDSVLSEIARTKIILFILVAIGPFLTAGLAFIFITGFTKPVNILLDATRKLKGGDLDYRVGALRDEFGELARSFNEMAGSLKTMYSEMQRTEQIAAVGQLAGGLAHEIKNPLAAVKASMEVLTEEPTIEAKDKDILLKAIAEIRRIELLMKDFLNFARPPKPQFIEANVNKIIDTVLTMLTFSLKTHCSGANNSEPIKIVKAFDDGLPAVMADPMQLQQVFLNLTLNAVDAMPGGGIIHVRTLRNSSPDHIQIEVADTGRGIEAGVGDKIFHPFFTTKSKGTGLGLAITKRLIEQHGGVIGAENIAEGGALFRIVLPVARGETRGA